MAETIFSKIIRREVPSYKVYEDDHTLAFLDIFPHAKGHTVVIPKREVVFFHELTDGEVAALFVAVKRVMKKLSETLSPDAFTVGWNHGELAGQSVAHLHIHVMPRYEGDGGGSIHSVVNSAGNLTVKEVAEIVCA